MRLSEQKEIYLREQLWICTVGASFQRTNVYKEDVSQEERIAFRNDLFETVKKLLPAYRKSTPRDSTHISNIKLLQSASAGHKKILIGGKLTFGVSQKLLNLYLKYLWCAGMTKTPPHFPVDRIIQQRLKMNLVVSWTTVMKEKEYLLIINEAKRRAGELKCSVAELELRMYNMK